MYRTVISHERSLKKKWLVVSNNDKEFCENFRGIICHDTEGNAKFKEKPTCCFKNDIRNLVNFRASRQKSEILHFDWILLPKAYNI